MHVIRVNCRLHGVWRERRHDFLQNTQITRTAARERIYWTVAGVSTARLTANGGLFLIFALFPCPRHHHHHDHRRSLTFTAPSFKFGRGKTQKNYVFTTGGKNSQAPRVAQRA